MHQPVEENMHLQHDTFYIHTVMSHVDDELRHYGDTPDAMWVHTEQGKSAFEYMELYIGEPNVDEMLLDHDSILLARALRLGQIH